MYSCDIITNLAAILFLNFGQEKGKKELGMGQIWNQHIRIV